MPATVDPRPGSVRVGRVSGTEIRVSASCLVVVALIAVAFAPRADSLVPGPQARAWAAGVGVGVLVYVAALVHEAAHALVARRHGRRVPAIVLTAAGGRTHVVGESAGPREEGVTAAVGPAVSLVLGLSALALRLVVTDGVAAVVLEALVLANLLIGGLDLLPTPPLDGGRVVRAVAWHVAGSRSRGAIVAAWTGRGVAAVLLLVPLSATVAGAGPGLSLWAVCGGIALLAWVSSSAELGFNRMRLQVEGLSLGDVARPLPPYADAADGADGAGSAGPAYPVPALAYDGTLDQVLEILLRAPGTDHLLVDHDGTARGLVSSVDVDRVVGSGREA